MWTLSKGIGLTEASAAPFPLPSGGGHGRQRGREAGGRTPPHTEPHILCASWPTIKTVTVNQLCSGEAPWTFTFNFHLADICRLSSTGWIRRRVGTNTQVQAHGFSLAGLSHRFERYYCFERAHGNLDCVCKWVRASFLKNICVSVHAFWPLELTVARRGLRAPRGEKSIQWGIPIQIPI